ncbi:hypothetical protein ACFHWD_05520, partial [Clostridium sp. MT-14]|uniref:hypothetical protein n=1 Tax=Clostridium sp. MT-14 TaxID=3348360 RepID=UPI0035F3362C
NTSYIIIRQVVIILGIEPKITRTIHIQLIENRRITPFLLKFKSAALLLKLIVEIPNTTAKNKDNIILLLFFTLCFYPGDSNGAVALID